MDRRGVTVTLKERLTVERLGSRERQIQPIYSDEEVHTSPAVGTVHMSTGI